MKIIKHYKIRNLSFTQWKGVIEILPYISLWFSSRTISIGWLNLEVIFRWGKQMKKRPWIISYDNKLNRYWKLIKNHLYLLNNFDTIELLPRILYTNTKPPVITICWLSAKFEIAI